MMNKEKKSPNRAPGRYPNADSGIRKTQFGIKFVLLTILASVALTILTLYISGWIGTNNQENDANQQVSKQ